MTMAPTLRVTHLIRGSEGWREEGMLRPKGAEELLMLASSELDEEKTTGSTRFLGTGIRGGEESSSVQP